MHINDELIHKFLNGNCNPEEAEEVAAYLRLHPHLLDGVYNEKEFTDQAGADLPEADWQEMWQEMEKIRKRKTRVRQMAYTAAAACVAALMVYGYFLSGVANNRQKPAGTGLTAKKETGVFYNEADTSIRMVLDDGTLVDLQAHTTMRYEKEKWTRQRTVSIEGEAVFQVAKDKSRPFIVYCNGLSVQALGTAFAVKRAAGDQQVRVRLFEGKVVVKPHGTGAASRKYFETYLLPGQELILPLNNQSPYVQYFLKGNRKEVFVKKEVTATGIAPLVPSGWFEFTNQSVGDVFETLEILYGVHIQYQKEIVKDLFFIGKFEPHESVDDVLNAIALLNDLKIEKKTSNQYKITKK